jgi:hypothetical protein
MRRRQHPSIATPAVEQKAHPTQLLNACALKRCLRTVDLALLIHSSCSTIVNLDKKLLDSVSLDEYVRIRPLLHSVRGKLVSNGGSS